MNEGMDEHMRQKISRELHIQEDSCLLAPPAQGLAQSWCLVDGCWMEANG